MEMILLVALAITIFATMVAPASSAASHVMFLFGDSLTDVGNNNYLPYTLAKSNFPWYGVDYAGGRATGRFINGRTILGIPSPPPYLSLAQNDDALLKGVNYASGGAGILNDTGLYFIQRLSFDDQIQHFNRTKEAIKAKVGGVAAAKFCSQANYLIGIGSNDNVNNYLQPFLADSQQYTYEEFVELLMNSLEGQFTALPTGSSEDDFPWSWTTWLHPSQRVKSKTGQCLKRVNELVLEFNSKVQKLIGSLNRRLPKAKLSFADTYADVFDLVQNPCSKFQIPLVAMWTQTSEGYACQIQNCVATKNEPAEEAWPGAKKYPDDLHFAPTQDERYK